MSKRLVLIFTFSTLLAVISLIPKSECMPAPERPEWMHAVKFVLKTAKVMVPAIIAPPSSDIELPMADDLAFDDLDFGPELTVKKAPNSPAPAEASAPVDPPAVDVAAAEPAPPAEPAPAEPAPAEPAPADPAPAE